MNYEQLKEKYKNVPKELKVMKRWVGWKLEGLENGKTTKRPYNAMSGSLAKVNSELTWTNFNTALRGCEKYNFDGIGFILGQGIFGIDLDNHPDQDGNYPLTTEEFENLANEFIDVLDSYSEYSQSGKGVHIICEGKLPEGSRRKKGSPVEMYENGRFFAFTGDVIRNSPICFREKEVVPLWKKYVYTEEKDDQGFKVRREDALSLTDEELIEEILNSKNGELFYKYYHDGDISVNFNDHSSADMSFCNMLAFWCNGDKDKIDRIFRNSALMRDKWDQYRGSKTYGEITIDTACNNVKDGFIKKPVAMFTVKNKSVESVYSNETNSYTTEMNLDENGEPIFRIKKINKTYSYSDTGNAMRFYDYFGDLFKYNTTDKCFMFWTGKTWIKDTKNIIRKYANKMIDICKMEKNYLEEKQSRLLSESKKDEAASVGKILDACVKNASRVANKAGKDAMLFEFQSLYDIPVSNSEFDADDYLLNTDSGIVDLKTGEILPFDKDKMMSKNTNIKVSYNEPKVWLKFLYSLFDNGNEEETNELILSMQTCLGYSLTGSTREQVMFLLYGGGSNGKTTLTELMSYIIGDYGDTVRSDTLLQQKNGNNNANYTLAKLQGARFVETEETDEGGRLAEAHVKLLTGSSTISARFLYGNEFSYEPKFKIWMSTNNRPIIRGTDLGIWRRLVPFNFLNTFTGAQKDKDLPIKLRAEAPDILGWVIQGYAKYKEMNDLFITKRQNLWLEEYKTKMNVVLQFIEKECIVSEKSNVNCKELYSAYKKWAQDNTDYTVKESKFSDDLQKRGITVDEVNFVAPHYVGIRLKGLPFANIKDKR